MELTSDCSANILELHEASFAFLAFHAEFHQNLISCQTKIVETELHLIKIVGGKMNHYNAVALNKYG